MAAGLLVAGAALAQPAPDPAIDAIFARYDKPATPGCAVAVYRNGEIVFERGYGYANLEHDVPIAPDTVFYIGSVSKQFTAFAAALLVEQGKLTLSDTAGQHVPELPSWADTVTIDHLIHYTSGIRDLLTLWEISGRSFADAMSVETAIDFLARQRELDFAPGTQWSYSNSGYFLLAEIVGRATGTPLSRFAEDAIFAPLGMSSTHFHDDARRIVPRRAAGYLPNPDGGFGIVAASFALVGDGGVFSTVRDLAKWDENFYDNRLGGGAELIETIATQGRLANGDPHPYAYGLFRGTYRGLPIVEHGGSFIGYRSQLLRFPAEHTSVAVLCNDWTANAEDLARRVADVVLAGRFEAPPAPPAEPPVSAVEIPTEALRRFVGRYALAQPALFASVVERADGLALAMNGPELPLIPTSGTTFHISGLGGEIEFFVDGAQVSLSFRGAPFPPAPRLVPPELSRAEIAAYAGRCTSAELDTWFDIRVTADGGLELRRRYSPWGRMTVIAPDRFIVGPADVRFGRDDGSQPSGFSLTVPRATNIRFSRAPAMATEP